MDGSTEQRGDLRYGQPIEVAECEGASMVGTEALENVQHPLGVDDGIPRVGSAGVRIEVGVIEVDGRGRSCCPPPVVGELVPGDPDQPGDGHFFDRAPSGLADGRKERICGQVLGDMTVTATAAQVAEHERHGAVVQPDHLGNVLGALAHNCVIVARPLPLTGLRKKTVRRPRDGVRRRSMLPVELMSEGMARFVELDPTCTGNQEGCDEPESLGGVLKISHPSPASTDGRPSTSRTILLATSRFQRVIEVSQVVRNKAIAVGAVSWLEEIPLLIAKYEHEWGFAVGRSFQGGTEAYVAEANMHNGREAVLKLVVPRDGDAASNEITVLRLAGGEGCAELLRADVTDGALLMERLGPSLHDLGVPFRERLQILATAAANVWRPAPEVDLPTGADKGRWLVGFISRSWEELNRPCSERAIAYALSCAARRIEAHDDETAVLVHGDVHEWNALQATAGYKLVDPDGLLAEAEYDLGVMMREDPIELLIGDPFDRARWLAALTGLDATAIWEWGVVERVSTGLLCTSVDLQPVGRQMLAAADHVARWNSRVG